MSCARIIVIAIALTAAGAVQSARAAPIPTFFQLVPAAPSNADHVQLRMDVPGCTVPAQAIVNVSWVPRRIEVELRNPDIPCDPNNPAHTASTRFIDIGLLRAGTYAVRVVECEAPPGLFCQVELADSLLVTAVPARYLVPAVSWGSLGLLLAAIALFGLRGSWRGR
jgi:hypothetical protein